MRLDERGPFHCLECGAPFLPHDKFCNQCAQRTDTGRLTIHDIAHDYSGALGRVDRGVISLLRSLLIRPGKVALDYVGGKRRRHYGPFASLVVLVGITYFIINLSGFQAFTSTSRENTVAQFLQRHVNLILLSQAPLLGLFCAGLFRADRFNYAEHLVLSAYATDLRVVFFGFVAIPTWYFFRPDASAKTLVYIYWGLWFFYFGFAASQFYSGNRWLSWFKGGLAAALTQFAVIEMVNLASHAYDFYSRK